MADETQHNIRIQVAYHGAAYHGWAEQPSVPTVEGTLRAALSRLLATDAFALQGASRTDAGVHAHGQVLNVRHDTDRTPWDFVRGLNATTPDDIAVWHAEEAGSDFDARRSSTGKRYRYRIWPHRFLDPLRRDQTWHVRHALDVDAMRRAGAALVGEHDFTSFRAADCQAHTTVRELTRVEIASSEDELVLWVEGTAFLKYMVRNIAGTLVDVGRGQIAAEDVAAILAARDRSAAGQCAPPHGLTLMEVFYDVDPWRSSPRVGRDQRY